MILIEQQSQYDAFGSLSHLLRKLCKKSTTVGDMREDVYETYRGDYEHCEQCGKSLNRCAETFCSDPWQDDYWDQADDLYEQERDRKLMEGK